MRHVTSGTAARRWRPLVALLGVCLLWGSAATADDGSPPDLLAWNLDRRGADRLADVQSVRVDLTLLQPELTARLVVWARKPARIRVDVWIDGVPVFSEASDGSRGWFRVRDLAPRQSSPQGVARLRRMAAEFLYPLAARGSAGLEIEYLPATRIDGRRYPTVALTHQDAPRRLLFVDPVSGFVTRERAVTALQPDLNPEQRWIETLNSDFRLVAGVAYPFQRDEVDLVTLDWLQTLVIDEMMFDPPWPKEAFSWRTAPTQPSP